MRQSDWSALHRTIQLVSVAVGLFVWALFILTSWVSYERQRENFDLSVQEFTEMIKYNIDSVDYKGVNDISQVFGKRPEIISIKVIDAFGHVVHVSADKTPSSGSDEEEVSGVLEISVYDTRNFKRSDEALLGTIYLEVNQTSFYELGSLELIKSLLCGIVVYLICFAIFFYYYRRYVYYPMQKLHSAIEISQESGQPAMANFQSETTLGRLAFEFNVMQDKLAEYTQRQNLQLKEKIQLAELLRTALKDLNGEKAANDHLFRQVGQILEIVEQHVSLYGEEGALVYSNLSEKPEIVDELSFLTAPTLDLAALVEELRLRGLIVSLRKYDDEGGGSKHFMMELGLDNQQSWMLRAEPLEGGMTALICTNVDKIRELEKEIRHAQKMESLGALTSGVAHEFNNILSIIVANLDLVLDITEENSESFKYLDVARKSCDRAAETIGQILAYSHKNSEQITEVGIEQLLCDVKGSLMSILPGNISLSIVNGSSKYIRIDNNNLQAAIINLARNAIQAMPLGGELKIASADIEPPSGRGMMLDSPMISLKIIDSGVGLSSELMDRIFDPFFTTKDVGEGTGLGLWTVYGFLKNSGGSISCEANEGGGSCFTVFLPACNELPEPSRHFQQRENSSREAEGGLLARRVLLVDDELNLLEILKLFLENEGADVDSAQSLSEALALLKGKPEGYYDALLCDQNLPDGDGVELLNLAMSRQPGVVTILMSGYLTDSTSSGNFDRQLQKPVTLKTLRKALVESLSEPMLVC